LKWLVNKTFGVFQRLYTNEEFESTHIDLANVKQIKNKRNGEIKAEGKINEGANFFITLPK
jgi:light-regulated signal transduction histidine kinase (bacteriophytochrome)